MSASWSKLQWMGGLVGEEEESPRLCSRIINREENKWRGSKLIYFSLLFMLLIFLKGRKQVKLDTNITYFYSKNAMKVKIYLLSFAFTCFLS